MIQEIKTVLGSSWPFRTWMMYFWFLKWRRILSLRGPLIRLYKNGLHRCAPDFVCRLVMDGYCSNQQCKHTHATNHSANNGASGSVVRALGLSTSCWNTDRYFKAQSYLANNCVPVRVIYGCTHTSFMRMPWVPVRGIYRGTHMYTHRTCACRAVVMHAVLSKQRWTTWSRTWVAMDIMPDLPFLHIHNPFTNERISVYLDKHSRMSFNNK